MLPFLGADHLKAKKGLKSAGSSPNGPKEVNAHDGKQRGPAGLLKSSFLKPAASVVE